MEKTSSLLFITQKIDERDDDLAFVTQWIDTFIAQGYSVKVITLGKGEFDGRFPVYSLGKEQGAGKMLRTLRFLKLIFSLKYDRVFVHMNPEYFIIGGWWWLLNCVPSYIWYTHYSNYFPFKVAARFCTRMFAATEQSMPQYVGNPKRIITGHGVDVKFWSSENHCTNEKDLLMVHRISRSKRVELGIRALALLPKEYTLAIYGRPIDPDYFTELKELVEKLDLADQVIFKGPLPMPELRAIYPKHRIMINMASETIDKTMLEAMVNGVFPVTTQGNAHAIGLSDAPLNDTPEAIAEFIREGSASSVSQGQLVKIVEEKHSLDSLVSKMGGYIKKGN